MRIGILTYHRSYNYGAFMQAYALSKKIKEELPEDSVEIVDYLPKRVYCHYRPSFTNNLYLLFHNNSFHSFVSNFRSFVLWLKQTPSNINSKGNPNFDDALKYLPLSKDFLLTDRLSEISEYINNNYDILIVGSDAVWNWAMRPFPNAYLLGEDIKTRKMSYAASSFGQPYREISKRQKSYLDFSWRSYDYIGVRDLMTEEFVKYVNNSLSPNHNCDPTVFLDMENLPVDKLTVRQKLMKAGWDPCKITIGLMAKPWLAKLVREQLGDNYQIVSVYMYSEYADVNLLDINPFEWAILFSFFSCTITHYFHGNLLSLKNGTPTVVIEKKNTYHKLYGSKIRDFMKRVGCLENCYYLEELTTSFDLKLVIGKILDESDYKKKIFTAIENEAKSCNSFIDTIKYFVENRSCVSGKSSGRFI